MEPYPALAVEAANGEVKDMANPGCTSNHHRGQSRYIGWRVGLFLLIMLVIIRAARLAMDTTDLTYPTGERALPRCVWAAGALATKEDSEAGSLALHPTI